MNAAEDEFADDDIDLAAAADLPPLVTFTLPRDEVERWAGEVLRVAGSATDAPGLAAAAASGSADAAGRLLALLNDLRDRSRDLLSSMIACGIEPQREESPTVFIGPSRRQRGFNDAGDFDLSECPDEPNSGDIAVGNGGAGDMRSGRRATAEFGVQPTSGR